MRLVPVAACLLACLVAPASAVAADGTGGASAPGGAAAPASGTLGQSGGTVALDGASGPARAVVRSFSVAPARVTVGGTLTFAFRVNSRAASVRAQVQLLRVGSTRATATATLGPRRTGRGLKVRWTPAKGRLPAGRYRAQLRLSGRGVRRAQAAAATPLQVVAPAVAKPAPAPAPTPAPTPTPVVVHGGVFPVQGAHSFGDAADRFGAVRSGHVHQGQDILAADGTPVVSPLAGSVYWSAYQAAAAGYYLVIRAASGTDYVFMHLQAGSILVTKGQAVSAGQRIALVGHTGDAQGPHLHFEIWPDGWWSSSASKPIDPLPQLLAWGG